MPQPTPLLRRTQPESGLAAERKPELPDERRGEVPGGWTPVNIATWNIHSCVGIDARFAPDRIAGVIRSLNADVVGLQEVGWHHRGESGIDQFDFLEKATGMTALAGPTKHHRTAHYGNCLLTRLPVLAVDMLDLSLPIREPRGALSALLETGATPLRVIVAHLGLDPWERNTQVTRVLEFVESQPPGPTVFMGDLNEWRPGAPRLKRLSERLPDCAAPRSFHARLPTLRLDRIFVSPELHLAAYEVVRNATTRRASDHLPVRALVGVPPPDATRLAAD